VHAGALTAQERRGFRRLERGLRRTDPVWLASHCPRRHRLAAALRCGAGMAAVVLVVVGAVTGAMIVVFGAVLLGCGCLTSVVSSRATTNRTESPR
jgi:hypothetical protein